MERGLILLVAALMVYVAPGVQGTAHLSFSNDTVNITRSGCGATKLCVETPEGCDPTGNTSCLFMSVVASTPMAPNGVDLSIELRGKSSGYIALGLTQSLVEGSGMVFICAQNGSNNGSFFFRTMQRNNTNNELTASERRVTDIRGMVYDTVIKCEFNVPGVNATSTRSSHATTFSVLLGSGSVNGNALGPFMIARNTNPLNLANPASNVTTPTTTPTTTMASNVTTTMASTTPAASGAVQPHAVLLLLSVLMLSAVLRA